MEQKQVVDIIVRQVIDKLKDQIDVRNKQSKENSISPSPTERKASTEGSRYIDNKILMNAEATKQQIEKCCEEARRDHFNAIIVTSNWVADCVRRLRGTDTVVGVLIGSPLGAMDTRSKAFETRRAIEDGAQEVDLIMNIGAIKARDLKTVEEDIKAVFRATRSTTVLKVIIESNYLTDEEKIIACEIAQKAGVGFVITSTDITKHEAKASGIVLMKILVLAPFGAIVPNAKENLISRARPGTEVHVECLEDVYPLPYTTYQYNLTKVIDGTVERAIRAEAEGYDAMLISNMLDPGLIQARGVVDIPVMGTMEATAHVASMMGNRFALISTDATNCAMMDRLLTSYGLRDKVACIRHIDIVSSELYPEKTPTEEVFNRVKEQAEKAVREDGAEVIIPSCTLICSLLTQQYGEKPSEFLAGVPVLDGMVVGLKTTELIVDMVQMGYLAVSRLGFWKKQPAEEFTALRQWFATHESPFKYNLERMPKQESK